MEIADEHVRRTFLPDIPNPKLTDRALVCQISVDSLAMGLEADIYSIKGSRQ